MIQSTPVTRLTSVPAAPERAPRPYRVKIVARRCRPPPAPSAGLPPPAPPPAPPAPGVWTRLAPLLDRRRRRVRRRRRGRPRRRRSAPHHGAGVRRRLGARRLRLDARAAHAGGPASGSRSAASPTRTATPPGSPRSPRVTVGPCRRAGRGRHRRRAGQPAHPPVRDALGRARAARWSSRRTARRSTGRRRPRPPRAAAGREARPRDVELPPRAAIQARDGTPLAEGEARLSELGALASEIAGRVGPAPPERAAELERRGVPAGAPVGLTGLEREFDTELAGTPGGELRAGERVLASVAPQARQRRAHDDRPRRPARRRRGARRAASAASR